MKHNSSLVAKFALAMLLACGLMMATGRAHAQSIPPGPCPTYWVNYNYVYPPAPNGALSVSIQCADGRIFPATVETSDGHYTYPSDPTCVPASIIISWAGGSAVVPVPIPPASPLNPPFTASTPWGLLRVEPKFDSNGCLEIDLSY